MKKKYLLSFLLIMILICPVKSQEKEFNYNFLKGVSNPTTHIKTGIMKTENYYEPTGGDYRNIYGDLQLFFIHKSTPKNWLLVANRKFADSCKNLSSWCATKDLFNNHKNLLNDFEVYVFFVDKKYIAPFEETCEKGSCVSYGLKEDIDYEVILYHRKANETNWTEIKRHTFGTGIKYNSNNSRGDFLAPIVEEKIKQSNSNFIPIRRRVFRNSFITDHLLNTSTKEELSKLRKQELRILRNAYFARLGYKFRSKDLQEFFNQFDWYKKIVGAFPNDFYTLTKEEKNRVDLIRNLENNKTYKK